MLQSKYQHTVKTVVIIKGIGVHSGEKATIKINPTAVNTGIVFVRTDIKGIDNIIPAKWDNVADTKLCTALSNKDGVRVSTVEHLMSAFSTLGVDNAVVEIDGPEIPIMDGSSVEFIKKIRAVGLEKQKKARRKAILIKRPICASENGVEAYFTPSRESEFSFEIEFASKAIGIQEFTYKVGDNDYMEEIAPARTFGFLHEVEYLRSLGLGKGGSLDNAVVIDKDTIMNPDGLRYKNEFVRHKVLDAVGDVYLSGMQVIGHYHGYKSSHAMNNRLLRELFANPDAYEIIDYIPLDNKISAPVMEENPSYYKVLAVA